MGVCAFFWRTGSFREERKGGGGFEEKNQSVVDVATRGGKRWDRLRKKKKSGRGFESAPPQRTACCRVGLPFREETTAACIARRARRERGHSPTRWKGKRRARKLEGEREKEKMESGFFRPRPLSSLSFFFSFFFNFTS